MPFDRRAILAAGAALVAATPGTVAAAGPRPARGEVAGPRGDRLRFVPNGAGDQSAALQSAIDRAAADGRSLHLSGGRILARDLTLRPGTILEGEPGRTTLALSGGGVLLRGERADGVRLRGLAIEGGGFRPSGAETGVIDVRASRDVVVADLEIRNAAVNAISLTACSGRISDNRIALCGGAAIHSLDATGLEISHNHIADCANNGILVWRSAPGEDGTVILANRIERIRAAAGGSGQNGNGVNVFRAGGVLVTSNRISDCAYTAVRANAASNVQIVSNSCARLGEVALYAEFAFEGALIASNLVDGAAAGISVTNFNEGGRLAVIQGNLVRNLHRREDEPVDKRGEGIAVEADAVVTGNVVENAPTAGIVVGWGAYMRDVVATSNVIRHAGIGIMISADPAAGSCLVAHNLIAQARDGAIRAMDKGRALGPDLVRTGTASTRVTLTGNVAV